MDRHVTPSCSGTGVDGNRVQVIYAVERGQTDRYRDLRPAIQSWIGDVDDTFAVSARKTGGDLRVRWVHDDCVPVIAHEVLPAGALGDGFSATIKALRDRGYTSKTRKYLVFADSATLCGFANVDLDSSATDNDNDGRYPMYARVDSPCWEYREGWHSVVAHEVMHTLGAVQHDAPHGNPPGVHCFDETDVMCYDDGSERAMQLECQDSEALFDCGNDDYLSLRPPAGSYLDTHWNVANSSFLDDLSGHATRIATTITPSVITAGSAATIEGDVTRVDGTGAVDGETVRLYLQPVDSTTWSQVDAVTTDSSGAYTFSARPSSNGEYSVRFVPDTPKYTSSNGPAIPVDVRTSISAEFSTPVTVRGVGTELRGNVSPDHHGYEVYLQRGNSNTWEAVASTTLSESSSYTFQVNEPRPGSYIYRVHVPVHGDHAVAWSPERSLLVL